jgi:phosphoglucosamine mutase
VIAVDEHGVLVDGDEMLAIAAIDLRDRGLLRGDAVVATVMSNFGLQQALQPYDVELVRTPVGDRNVLDELESRDLVLGGEQSGHVINRLHAPTGDGTLTGILLLDTMARRNRTLSELASVMTRVPQVVRNVPMTEPESLNRDHAFWSRVGEIEGEFAGGGRVLVRPSGTEPLVRVMVESSDTDAAEATADRLVALIEHVARRNG